MSSITSVSSFNATTWLNKIEGVTPVPAPTTTPAPTPAPTASATTPTPAPATGKSTPGNILGLSSTILSLLQETSPGSANGSVVSDLFASSSISSSDSSLAGLYGSLLATDSSTLPIQVAVQTAQNQQQKSATATDPLQNILKSYNSGINAYNNTLIQNAQAAITASKAPLPSS